VADERVYSAEEAEGHPSSEEAAPLVGVCLGSYGYPRLIETQIRTLRQTCGAVPILVADDRTADPRFEEILALEQKYPGVEVWYNESRQGHYAGDLSVFWKAAHWGASSGLRVVCKLSQRLLVLEEAWVQAWAAKLLKSRKAACYQWCWDNGGKFDTESVELFMRSECVFLDVTRWSQPTILRELEPRTLGSATESHLNAIMDRHFFRHEGPARKPDYLPFDLLNAHRYKPNPGKVIWHCTHVPDHYRRHARSLGITLEGDFGTSGWPQLEGAGYKVG